MKQVMYLNDISPMAQASAQTQAFLIECYATVQKAHGMWLFAIHGVDRGSQKYSESRIC